MSKEREKNGWALLEKTEVNEVWSNKVSIATGVNSTTKQLADGAAKAASTAVTETATSVHPAVKAAAEVAKKAKDTSIDFLSRGVRNNTEDEEAGRQGGLLIAIAAVVFLALAISNSVLPNILIPGICSVIFQQAEEEEEEDDD